MASKKPLKGMIDVTPKEAILRREVQSKIVETFIENGFFEIATPSLENIDLLCSNEGGDNEKIMFKVLKRGEKLNLENIKNVSDLVDMGLRFDLTIPLSRFYANNQNDLPTPFKCFQIGNVWRGERPQKGRYRQFIQCDVDILGDDTVTAEISLIKTICDALSKLGFNDVEIMINNRMLINELLSEYNLADNAEDIMIILDKLDKISFEKACAEIENKGLDVEKFKKLYERIELLEKMDVSELKTVFNSAVVDDFLKIIKVLNNAGYKVNYDSTLIRGMGYYTGSVFEIKDKSLGLSIAGGGRYDKLIGKLIGTDVAACGFSIGFERIVQILLENPSEVESNVEKYVIFVDNASTVQYENMLDYMKEEQQKGKVVSLVSRKKNVKKQISDLSNLGYSKFFNTSDF